MLVLPTALLSSKGDFVRWDLWDFVWLQLLGCVWKYGKILLGVSGTQLLMAPFCILLRRLKCAPFQTLLNRICL